MNYVKDRSRSKGLLLFTPHDSDKPSEQHTITCCHCNRLWLYVPGSGRERGYCRMCDGFTCGSTKCNTALNGCGPFEKKLEVYERRTRIVLDGSWDLDKGGIWVQTMNEVKLRA